MEDNARRLLLRPIRSGALVDMMAGFSDVQEPGIYS